MLNILISKEVVQQHVDLLFNFVNENDPELAEHQANDIWSQVSGMQRIVCEAEKQFVVLADLATVDRQALFEYFEIRDVLVNGLKKAQEIFDRAVAAQSNRN